jgi:glycopeptide antibiotics resistance protein
MDYIIVMATNHIATEYIFFAFILAGLTTIYCRRQGKKSTIQSLALFLLVMYVFLVFASTVLSRTSGDSYDFEWLPFWSYLEIWKGSEELFWEDVFNVLMLLPIGVLLPIAIGPAAVRKKGRKHIFFKVVCVGFATSLIIEVLQLILKRGKCEFDDLFHNTLGVVIGYGMFVLFDIVYERVKRKEGKQSRLI